MADHLRDRIAAALYERERPPRDPHWPDVYAADREVFEAMADTVLAALLTSAERQPRIPLDHLTSDQLDRLYDDLDRYAEVLGEMNEQAVQQTKAIADEEATSRRLLEQRQEMAQERFAWQERGDRAEAALAKVAGLRDDLRGITGARWIADALDNILDQTAPEPAVAPPVDTGDCCGTEPPLPADHPDTRWGDCWCTLPPRHDGQHQCQPCTERHDAPAWDDATREQP